MRSLVVSRDHRHHQPHWLVVCECHLGNSVCCHRAACLLKTIHFLGHHLLSGDSWQRPEGKIPNWLENNFIERRDNKMNDVKENTASYYAVLSYTLATWTYWSLLTSKYHDVCCHSPKVIISLLHLLRVGRAYHRYIYAKHAKHRAIIKEWTRWEIVMSFSYSLSFVLAHSSDRLYQRKISQIIAELSYFIGIVCLISVEVQNSKSQKEMSIS